MGENKYNKGKFENYYTDWIPFIHNTQEKIEQLEQVGASCFIKAENLVVFYSKVKLFVAVRSKYLKKIPEEIKKLEEVGSFICSNEFYSKIKNEKEFFKNPKYITNLNKLINLLSNISKELSNHKLLYDIDEVDTDEEDIVKEGRNSAEKAAFKAFKHLIFQKQGLKK